jgi:hypothetical protein
MCSTVAVRRSKAAQLQAQLDVALAPSDAIDSVAASRPAATPNLELPPGLGSTLARHLAIDQDRSLYPEPDPCRAEHSRIEITTILLGERQNKRVQGGLPARACITSRV